MLDNAQYPTREMTWKRLWRAAVAMAADCLCIYVASFFALWLRFEFQYEDIDPEFLHTFRWSIGIWIAICVGVFALFGMYQWIWRFVGLRELERMAWAYAVLCGIALGVLVLTDYHMPRSYYVLSILLSFCATCGVRFGFRIVMDLRQEWNRRRSGGNMDNIMVIGAGAAGKSLVEEYASSRWLRGKVVCLIDDNPAKWGKFLEGVQVVGGRGRIPEAVMKYQVDQIVFAIPTASAQEKKEILSICNSTHCPIRTVPGIYQLVNGEVSVSKLRKVGILDLLGREPTQVDTDQIARYLGGRVVLVTGGGGSIGSELCRQIARQNPRQLIIFDIYENNAYDIQMELSRKFPQLDLQVRIGSVRNRQRVDAILEQFRPEVVFHAAAHKHVPLMEDSPNEAIKNNVFGTYNMALAADRWGVSKFVLISTDKAVNPTNIMGASKRLCEMVIQMVNRQSRTEFAAVRFGNVLDSNGSVIPLFRRQIEEGGPVTVTHKDITRFFMTIPEAVSLVLQAGCYARGGEIFILDMGSPVRIDDMARNLIRLSGLEPDVDIQIAYTGLRPGEKLYEELMMQEEGLRATDNQLIHICKPMEMDDEQFRQDLEALAQAAQEECGDIRPMVARMVPTYHPAGQAQTV